MKNKYSFNVNGVTLSLPNGDVVLNAGANITIKPSGALITFSATIPSNLVVNNLTPWQLPSLADANAPKGSMYYSTTAGKAVFKDSAGSVHNLY